jgi:hypothetical protein
MRACALQDAIAESHVELASLLQRHGAKVKNKNGAMVDFALFELKTFEEALMREWEVRAKTDGQTPLNQNDARAPAPEEDAGVWMERPGQLRSFSAAIRLDGRTDRVCSA